MSLSHSETIVVVEDDENTAALIAVYLEKEGFIAQVAHDGGRGLRLARRHAPVMVILDLMLPGMDGWEVCRELRKFSEVPVIMLTARGDEIDRITGLTLGADDYVVKPFSPRELVARVRAILRRTRRVAEGEACEAEQVFQSGSLVLDAEKRRVTVAGGPVDLTPHEYAILHRLMSAPGRVFSRDELIAALYPDGRAHVVDRVVDVHVGKLRQKIEPVSARPRFILTVRGVGYRFRDPDDA